MKKAFSIFLIVFILLSSVSTVTHAQCAMCQATVESNIDNGGHVGRGLNDGIMYLLAAPYIAMLGIGYLWYKKYRKKSVIVDMKRDLTNL